MSIEIYQKLIVYSLIFAGVILEVVGDVTFKKWSIDNKNIVLVFGLVVYFLGTLFWAYSLKYQLLSKGVVIFTLLNLVLTAVLGIFLFNEQVSTINKLGIALAIISILLIEL